MIQGNGWAKDESFGFSLHLGLKLSPHCLHLMFVFFFCFSSGFLFEMPEAVDTACVEGQSVCDLCILYGLRKCGQQQQKVGGR